MRKIQIETGTWQRNQKNEYLAGFTNFKILRSGRVKAKEVIGFANAKINIGLYITEKRADGFHNIETVFFPLKWKEPLEVLENNCFSPKATNRIDFTSSGISIDGSLDSNLCVRAYKLLLNDFELPPVKMHLHKLLPIGAGLGGGSSDASAAIVLLNNLFHLHLQNAAMQDYARKIGSDCAFFIENKSVFAYGKGDLFQSIEVNLKGYFLVLVCPQIHVATASAYSGVRPKKAPIDLHEAVKLPLHQWRDLIKNDFETSVFLAHPDLQIIKQRLYDEGALYASMSGSGSSIYGLFETPVSMKTVFKDCLVWEELI
jgi:4-diphosphocytidyl-2-C-methyl-D-erythritol kinase